MRALCSTEGNARNLWSRSDRLLFLIGSLNISSSTRDKQKLHKVTYKIIGLEGMVYVDQKHSPLIRRFSTVKGGRHSHPCVVQRSLFLPDLYRYTNSKRLEGSLPALVGCELISEAALLGHSSLISNSQSPRTLHLVPKCSPTYLPRR